MILSVLTALVIQRGAAPHADASPAPRPGQSDALPYLGAMDLPRPNNADWVAADTTLRFANRLVDQIPYGVDRLIRSKVGSDEASESFGDLSAVYEGCLEGGRILKVSRLSLRTALVDQLYRRALTGAQGNTTSVAGKQ